MGQLKKQHTMWLQKRRGLLIGRRWQVGFLEEVMLDLGSGIMGWFWASGTGWHWGWSREGISVSEWATAECQERMGVWWMRSSSGNEDWSGTRQGTERQVKTLIKTDEKIKRFWDMMWSGRDWQHGKKGKIRRDKIRQVFTTTQQTLEALMETFLSPSQPQVGACPSYSTRSPVVSVSTPSHCAYITGVVPPDSAPALRVRHSWRSTIAHNCWIPFSKCVFIHF